jgi:hypothetical protein
MLLLIYTAEYLVALAPQDFLAALSRRLGSAKRRNGQASRRISQSSAQKRILVMMVAAGSPNCRPLNPAALVGTSF